MEEQPKYIVEVPESSYSISMPPGTRITSKKIRKRKGVVKFILNGKECILRFKKDRKARAIIYPALGVIKIG